MTGLVVRASRFAALGDATRLAIVDELRLSDRSPTELRATLGIESNLLAHHLDALEAVGLIERSTSSGDRRRRYVRLVSPALGSLTVGPRVMPGPALFICTRNSARSQLAAGLWRSLTGAPAQSAGTHPAPAVHPGAVAAARRFGVNLDEAVPTSLDEVGSLPPIVVTVCDQAHEELAAGADWRHWSIADPVVDGRRVAFDRAASELRDRIEDLVK